ncbi:MAG: single-stranded DNA-binding protein [Lachnospiraceae bacterium]|nr:single-stranded DNA-binding protein [Lachnospiraceae bacterium]
MNKILLMGRLTADPEVRYSQGEKPVAIARYSLAVDKKQKRDDGIKTDFFRIVALGHQGEFAEKYLRKGMKMLVTGHVQTGSYVNRDGVKMPFFEVFAEEQEFAENKKANVEVTATAASVSAGGQRTGRQNPGYTTDNDGFITVPEDEDDLLFI